VSADLIRELELLSAEIDWPATPAFASAAKQAPRAVARRPRRLVVAVAIALLLAAAAALAATGVIHVGGATIKRVQRLPPAHPVASMRLGTPIGVARATRLAHASLPPRLRAPDAAYRDSRGISFVYMGANGPRAILGVLHDSPALIDKLVSMGTPVRHVRVQGVLGVYVAGTHVVDFLYGPGRRLSRPTLLWARGGRLYRLEARDPLALASAR
jgi:hypothetical protein